MTDNPFGRWAPPPNSAPATPPRNAPPDANNPFAQWAGSPAAAPAPGSARDRRALPEDMSIMGTIADQLGGVPKGAIKSVVGKGVGLGQLASEADPSGIVGEVGSTRPAQAVKDWSRSRANVGESVGATLPAFALRGGGGWLSNVIQSMIGGFLSEGLEPTEHGTLEEHETNAAIGAGGGAAVGGIGGRIPGAVRHLPIFSSYHFPLHSLAAYAALHGANTKAAQAVRREIARDAPGVVQSATEALRSNDQDPEPRSR